MRPKENRIRRMVHLLPGTDSKLAEDAKVHGTMGKAIDALYQVVGTVEKVPSVTPVEKVIESEKLVTKKKLAEIDPATGRKKLDFKTFDPYTP